MTSLRLLSVVAVICLPLTILASSCGKSGVPYSFEVLDTGAPVLGCAQPSCVISPEDFTEDSDFLTDVNGQADGYFREGDRALKRYRHDSAPRLVANCSGGFSQLSCPRKNQWVGGVEYIDHPRQPLILQCCSFDGLRFSQEVGMTVVNPGEAVTGGEVIRNGRQISFDVIANVRKIVQPGHGHKPSYEVTVRRMNCLPDPPEPEVDFDKDVPSEILKVLSTAKNGKDLGTKEKFEKISEKKKEHKKKKSKKTNEPTPQQFGAKQFAANSENSIAVDGSSNLEPLPTAAPQPIHVQPQAPQPLPQQPQQPAQPQVPQVPTNPVAPYQPQPYPGFGAPIGVGGFPGFPAPTPAPGFGPFPTFPTFAPFGVTPAPLGAGFGSTTSSWEKEIANQPPRPTYANGITVFPTIGTAFMTPMPLHHTFPPLGGVPAVVTPVPPVPPQPQPAQSGAPSQTNLPDLARPPPLPRLEQQVSQQGSAATISAVNGAPAATQAQAQAAPTLQGGAPALPGFPPAPVFQHQPLPGFPTHPPLQPFTFPPHPPHHFHTFTLPPHQPLPGFPPHPAPAAASGAAANSVVTPPTLPPMPAFSFPTLPPHQPFTFPNHQQIAGGNSQPSAPLTNNAPAPAPSAASATGVAAAQGAVLFPAATSIQFPGLTPIGGHKK